MSPLGRDKPDDVDGDSDTDTTDRLRIGRRQCLKTVGLATTATFAVGSADAAEGYGSGGYGEGEYGATTTDATLTVTTGTASAVAATSVEVDGDLTDLGGAASADVGFEYRAAGVGSWQSTPTEQVSATGTFSQQLSGLTSETTYEFRATAASESETATGSIETVTTKVDESATTAPSVERFNVSEAGSPNPHASITAVWDVFDADEDLGEVVIDVTDDTGTTVRRVSWSVNGARASDVDEFRIKFGEGTDYTLTLTVTDRAGNATTATRTVSA